MEHKSEYAEEEEEYTYCLWSIYQYMRSDPQSNSLICSMKSVL